MSNDPIRAALERLVWLSEQRTTSVEWADAFTAARAALEAASEGEPSDADLHRTAFSYSQPCFEFDYIGFAHSVLARWGRPTAPPAPLEGEVDAPRTRRACLWSPTQMAECGGPCWKAQDPSACECGALWVDVPATPAAPPAPLQGEVR